MHKIICISGQIGAGKDYLTSKLLDEKIGLFAKLTGNTTRKQRVGEIEGKEYHFITEEEFHKMNSEHPFIATRAVEGIRRDDSRGIVYYGLSHKDVDLFGDKMQITILDPNGTKQMASYIGRENCIIVRLVCDRDEVIRRATEIRGDNVEELKHRLFLDDFMFKNEDDYDLIFDTTKGTDSIMDDVIEKIKELNNK